MRKKSHISLAKFLVNNMQVEDLSEHKKSFYLGSILPDIKPSFLTKRHTFDETFGILIDEIKKITVDYDINKGINRYYARHLGVITHYLSDYCTYPHNSIFDGTMTEHIHYERELKLSLKEYVNREDTQKERKDAAKKCSLDDIIHLIYRIHTEYLKAMKNVQKDIQYIIELCYKVVDAIISFFEMALAQMNKDYDMLYAEN